MALQTLGVDRRRIFDKTELDSHRVCLRRCVLDGRHAALRAVAFTPRLVADSGLAPQTRLALLWDTERRVLILKFRPGPGRPAGTRTGGPSHAGVLQWWDWGPIPPEIVTLYFPDYSTGIERFDRSDCRITIVPNPDGTEIHVHPPNESGHMPEPDPDGEEIDFGIG